MSKYFAFLLRIWLAGSDQQVSWYASLENPHSRKIEVFHSLDALHEHLLYLTKNAQDEALESPPVKPFRSRS